MSRRGRVPQADTGAESLDFGRLTAPRAHRFKVCGGVVVAGRKSRHDALRVLLFPRDIEQLVTLRDVEGIEKLGAKLRTMRAAAESVERAASPPTQNS